MKKQNDEITLKSLLDIFLPKLWIVAIVAVLCAGIFGVYTYTQPDTYTSQMTIIVKAETEGIPTNNAIDGMQSLVADYRVILATRTFREAVIEKLKLDGNAYEELTSAQIASMMSIRGIEETSAFNISITSTDKNKAYAVASTMSDCAPEHISSVYPYSVKVTVVEEPQPAENANGKGTTRNALVGFAAGMIISLLVIFIVNRFDVVIHDRKKIEDAFDIPVLGVIPRISSAASSNTYGSAKLAETSAGGKKQ